MASSSLPSKDFHEGMFIYLYMYLIICNFFLLNMYEQFYILNFAEFLLVINCKKMCICRSWWCRETYAYWPKRSAKTCCILWQEPWWPRLSMGDFWRFFFFFFLRLKRRDNSFLNIKTHGLICSKIFFGAGVLINRFSCNWGWLFLVNVRCRLHQRCSQWQNSPCKLLALALVSFASLVKISEFYS